MSIPADIPNPDQENVYYTKAALKSELLAYFEEKKVEELLALFENDRLITFVWDISNAPNSFSLDVYPRNSSKYTIDLDGNGAFLIFGQNPELNTVEPEDFSNLKDGARTLLLDPSYHSDSLLKEPGDDNYSAVENKGLIDVLCATEFSVDMVELQQKIEYYEVLKSIVRDSLKALPADERKKYIDTYEASRNTIDAVNSSIDAISAGQLETYDQLIYENFVNDLYPDTVGVSISDGAKGIEGGGALLVQTFADLARITLGNNVFKANTRISAPNSDVFMNGTTIQFANVGIWRQFSENFLDKLPPIDMISGFGTGNNGTTFPIETGSGPIFQDTDKILYDSADMPIWKAKNGNGPKLNEWYYGNLDKKLKGEESDFSGLKDYIDTIKSMKEDYKKHADLKLLAGGSILVDQAVKKSILDLCLSNINVTDYAPIDTNGNNFFETIGRSGVLGPNGTTPYPTKYRTLPEGSFMPKPFSRNGFLCFQALVDFFSGFGSTSIDFLNSNISEQDSNHDKVVGMWKDFHGLIHEYNTVSMIGSGGNNSNETTSLKQALHLYVKDEEITTDLKDIYLVPNGDYDIPSNERTFFQFNVRRIKCAFQSDLVGYENIFSFQSGNMVQNKKLDLSNTNDVFRKMGFRDDDSKGKRTVDVDYTVATGSSSSSTSSSFITPVMTLASTASPSSLSFWKHRNYNMPYFWASCVSLWKAMTIGVLRELLESVNSILFNSEEEYIVLNDEELLELVDIYDLWDEILESVNSIKEMHGVNLGRRPSADGTITIYEHVGSNTGDMIDLHQNAIGNDMIKMIESYLDFVSSVSEHSKIERVESSQFRSINYNSILPLEAMQSLSNPNFSNSHGGPYYSTTAPALSTYLDKLEISDLEISEGRSIQKERSPAGTSLQSIRTSTDLFLDMTINHFRHLEYIDHVCQRLSNLRYFIEGFEAAEDVSDVFLKGYLSVEQDFKDPIALRNQIESKKNLYAADDTGIGNRWNMDLDGFKGYFENEKDNLSFVHVLGLKKDLWQNKENIFLKLEFINDLDVSEIRSINVPYDITSDTVESKRLQQWLHLYRGIDITETTFSDNTKLVWSEDVQKSESGIFPWTSKDFEENEPLRVLDNVFVMSPWVFPDNYFLDVANINEYHKIVFVGVYKDSIEDMDMAGTFEWSVVNDS